MSRIGFPPRRPSDDPMVHGQREGDAIAGSVDCSTRYVMLVHLDEDGSTTRACQDDAGLASPLTRMRTWHRRAEMSEHCAYQDRHQPRRLLLRSGQPKGGAASTTSVGEVRGRRGVAGADTFDLMISRSRLPSARTRRLRQGSECIDPIRPVPAASGSPGAEIEDLVSR
jgi:hypothetical protein